MAGKKELKTLITITALTAGVALVVELFGRRWVMKQFKMADEECLEDALTKDLRNELKKREAEAAELLKPK